MSKSKRTAGAKGPAETTESAKDSGSVEQSNQAVLDQLGPSRASAQNAGDAGIRDVAKNLVERGLFALAAEPRAPETVQKYVDVLGSSRLPSDRKAVLIDKLQTDQEAAVAAAAAVERWFGDADTGRQVLEQVWSALEVAEVPASASSADRAGDWIASLGTPAATSFCHEVNLLLALEEEEEEGLDGTFAVEMD